MVDGYIESITNKVLDADCKLNDLIRFNLKNSAAENCYGSEKIARVSKLVAEKNQLHTDLTTEEIKNYYLKKLEQLALSHIGDIPQTDEPTDEQKRWVLRALRRWRK